MIEVIQGEFYYCESDWLLKDNPTRVFRLDEYQSDKLGNHYFYPKEDIVCVPGGYINGNFQDMRFAVYDEINNYIGYVIDSFKSPSYISLLQTYMISDEMRENFRRMEFAFNELSLFPYLIKEYSNFGSMRKYNQWDTFSKEDRIVLNLFRAYYEYRLVRKNSYV